jgi:hypothetical protein
MVPSPDPVAIKSPLLSSIDGAFIQAIVSMPPVWPVSVQLLTHYAQM